MAKKTAELPQHILEDAAQLSPEEFNARNHTLIAKSAETGEYHTFHVRIVSEIRIYLNKPDF